MMCVCVCVHGCAYGWWWQGWLRHRFFFLNLVVILVPRQGNVGVMFVACQGFAIKFQICPRYLASVLFHPLLLPWPDMQGPI